LEKPPGTQVAFHFAQWQFGIGKSGHGEGLNPAFCRTLLSFFEEFLSNLRQLLAYLAGQPVMDTAGLYARDIRYNHGRRRGHSHDQPYHAEEKKAGQSDQLQYQRVPGRKMPYRAESYQEHHGGNAGHNH